MPPKPMTADAMRQSDALYIMDCIADQVNPIMLNISEVAARTGGKTNTIAKRFRIMRQRYSDLNILTSLRPNINAASSPATSSVKKVVSKQDPLKIRRSQSIKAEDESEIEDLNKEDDEDKNIDTGSVDELSTAKVTKPKRKRSSTTPTTQVRSVKKPKVMSVSNTGGSTDEPASEAPVANAGKKVYSTGPPLKRRSKEEVNEYAGERGSASMPMSNLMSTMPPRPDISQWNIPRPSLPVPKSSTTSYRSIQSLSEIDQLLLRSIDTPSPPEKSTQVEVDTPEYRALLRKTYSVLPPPLPPKSKKLPAFGGMP